MGFAPCRLESRTLPAGDTIECSVTETSETVTETLVGMSSPAHLIVLWRQGRFNLLTATDQLDKLSRVTRCPKIRERLAPALAGRLINELRDLAVIVADLPVVTICAYPYDNYLLAAAVAGATDFLVTGDKRDLLCLNVF